MRGGADKVAGAAADAGAPGGAAGRGPAVAAAANRDAEDRACGDGAAGGPKAAGQDAGRQAAACHDALHQDAVYQDAVYQAAGTPQSGAPQNGAHHVTGAHPEASAHHASGAKAPRHPPAPDLDAAGPHPAGPPSAVGAPAQSAPDRRLTPATERTALAGWGIERPSQVQGRPMRVAVPLTDLLRAPAGARDRQLLMGADVTLIEERDGWAFVRAEADGYCGWVAPASLSAERPPVTHRVAVPATHLYPAPDLKQRERGALSLGARLSVAGVEGRFARLEGGPADGLYVPLQHIADGPADDPAAVALSYLGTPYLWGGNSRAGIDCSGLVQAALHACARACPGDSDQQERHFPPAPSIARGDLLFWPGHVAMALDERRMVHATAWTMAVVIEEIAAAIARIEAAGDGPFRGARRPGGDRNAPFP